MTPLFHRNSERHLCFTGSGTHDNRNVVFVFVCVPREVRSRQSRPRTSSIAYTVLLRMPMRHHRLWHARASLSPCTGDQYAWMTRCALVASLIWFTLLSLVKTIVHVKLKTKCPRVFEECVSSRGDATLISLVERCSTCCVRD